MLILSGAEVVLPGGLSGPWTIVVDGERIADVVSGPRRGGERDTHIDLHGHVLVPGFIDVHVHGVEGLDVLDEGSPVAEIAARLPPRGVTSFCPTTIACEPAALCRVLGQVRRLAATPPPGAARVLPAHLESNFIAPDYRGAQPADNLCAPGAAAPGGFTAAEVLDEIARHRAEVGIVTVAPEIEGGLDLVAALARAGHRVSLGHSGAGYDVARAAIDAGATQGTHLFNRMAPLGHREPGVAGALLADERVATEVICDGRHVHPAMIRLAVAAKGTGATVAITDGTAGSGLPDGACAVLGGRAITVSDSAAYLADGTLAGSALTFDGAFRVLVERVGLSVADAAQVSSTAPARALGLQDRGTITPGLLADLVALDRRLGVAHTVVGGRLVYSRR